MSTLPQGRYQQLTEVVKATLTERMDAPKVSAQVVDVEATEAPELTKREEEIKALLLTGKKAKDIAQALLISEKTVKFHKTHLYKKLGVRSLAQFMLKELTKC